MAAQTTIQNVGAVLAGQGVVADKATREATFLKVFAGEVLTAFERMTVMMPRHMVRTIQFGKSAQFPVMGRTRAQYLKAGNSLDDQRIQIQHNEKIIGIDGLLTADVFITDIDDAMNHYDVRTEYSRQLGESLAVAADLAVINEGINLCAKTGGAYKQNIPFNTANAVVGTGAATEIVVGTAGQSAATVVFDKAFGQRVLDGLIAARAVFTKNYVPAAERYFICTPDTYSALIMALMPNAANYQALFNPETGKLMNVAGFEIIETPHLVQAATTGIGGTGDGSQGDPAHKVDATALAAWKGINGLAFHRSALGTVKLKDLAMERARRPEYQADEIIAKYAMGHGGLRPEAAAVFVDATQG